MLRRLLRLTALSAIPTPQQKVVLITAGGNFEKGKR